MNEESVLHSQTESSRLTARHTDSLKGRGTDKNVMNLRLSLTQYRQTV